MPWNCRVTISALPWVMVVVTEVCGTTPVGRQSISRMAFISELLPRPDAADDDEVEVVFGQPSEQVQQAFGPYWLPRTVRRISASANLVRSYAPRSMSGATKT
jgi:hypothetical protein